MSAPAARELRYERKYVVAPSTLPAVEIALRLHPAGFAEAFPARRVNNVYFDTPEFRYFLDTVEGDEVRRKVRLRWYGEPDLERREAEIFLEVKGRDGSVHWKERHRMAASSVAAVLVRGGLSSGLEASSASDGYRLGLHGLAPVLMNSYHRRYLESRDGRFRWTVDAGLQFRSLLPSPTFPGPVMASERVVVELKYGREDDPAAGRCARGLPLVLSRNSKYAEGVRLCVL